MLWTRISSGSSCLLCLCSAEVCDNIGHLFRYRETSEHLMFEQTCLYIFRIKFKDERVLLTTLKRHRRTDIMYTIMEFGK